MDNDDEILNSFDSENDFIRALIIGAIFIVIWLLYKKKFKDNDGLHFDFLKNRIAKGSYVIIIFKYLLMVNAILGIMLISSTWVKIVNELPSATEHGGWEFYTFTVWGFVLFNFIFSFYLSYRIGKKLNNLTIKLILYFLYFGIVAGFFHSFVLTSSNFSIYLNLPYGAEAEMYIKQIIKDIFIVPWIIYFKSSKFIKETYI